MAILLVAAAIVAGCARESADAESATVTEARPPKNADAAIEARATNRSDNVGGTEPVHQSSPQIVGEPTSVCDVVKESLSKNEISRLLNIQQGAGEVAETCEEQDPSPSNRGLHSMIRTGTEGPNGRLLVVSLTRVEDDVQGAVDEYTEDTGITPTSEEVEEWRQPGQRARLFDGVIFEHTDEQGRTFVASGREGWVEFRVEPYDLSIDVVEGTPDEDPNVVVVDRSRSALTQPFEQLSNEILAGVLGSE